MSDREVTVVPRKPADRDQVARDVEPTLAPEDDVVQRRILHELSAHSTAGAISLQHVVADLCRHQAKSFEL